MWIDKRFALSLDGQELIGELRNIIVDLSKQGQYRKDSGTEVGERGEGARVYVTELSLYDSEECS